jgi:hypothetical protein
LPAVRYQRNPPKSKKRKREEFFKHKKKNAIARGYWAETQVRDTKNKNVAIYQ